MNGRRRRTGMGLVLVILALVLVGLAVVLLTTTSSTIALAGRQSQNRDHVRNLQASALAWARVHSGQIKASAPVTLTADALECGRAQITVKRLEAPADRLRVRIDTTCGEGKSIVRQSREYDLPPQGQR